MKMIDREGVRVYIRGKIKSIPVKLSLCSSSVFIERERERDRERAEGEGQREEREVRKRAA